MNAAALPDDALDHLASAIERHELYAGRTPAAVPDDGKKPPSVKQELERKTLDELQRLVLALEHGKVTQGQFNAAIDSLWLTTAGLVQRDIMDLIEKTKVNLIVDESWLRETFVSTGERRFTVTVSWKVGTDQVTLTRVADGKVTVSRWDPPKDEIIPSMSAKKHFQSVCKSMKDRGFEPL
jgi:hypothetical protein